MKKPERERLESLLAKLDSTLSPKAINIPYWYSILVKVQELIDEAHRESFDAGYMMGYDT